ncbi:type III-A CRISPR-associated RAMP protein Csm5 [Microcoleus sp. T3_B1]|uniref:type III-A CRISPR-associated RAMP protein Csm5 n=1 Tax=Microcoleus sp. T3_B1 TaxID=3055425 RepID=UPI002FD49D32
MTATSHLAIKKPEASESKRIQLTSPILHIGSEVSRLNPFEYVQTSKRVYLPDREALAKVLYQGGRLDDYIRTIEESKNITKLLEDVLGDQWWNATGEDGDRIFPEIAVSHKWTENPVTDLRPMIRNGMGQLYIPGSSIKGAIRTAIAYHLLKHEEDYRVPLSIPFSNRVSEIEARLHDSMGAIKHNAKFTDDRLFMNSLFSDFALSYQGRAVNSKIGPNTDFMRAIKVTDSQPLELKKVTKQGKNVFLNLPIVAEVVVSSRFTDYKAKYRASIYAEMVRNVQTEFTISLDTEMLQWFTHNEGMQIPFKNLDELLKICQEFAQEQWDAEHDYWEDIKNNRSQGKDLNFSYIQELYEPTECPYSLRVGWASGMLGTTVSLCLDEKLVAEIRDTCGIKAPGFEAPKSRRTVVDHKGDIKYVPGWVKFKPC